MANNLHISYDLYAPGQNYDAVISVIKTLGSWAKIHKSFWYVDSSYSAADAVAAIWAVCDSNDSVYVVNATNNDAAWRNIQKEVEDHIKEHWHQ